MVKWAAVESVPKNATRRLSSTLLPALRCAAWDEARRLMVGCWLPVLCVLALASACATGEPTAADSTASESAGSEADDSAAVLDPVQESAEAADSQRLGLGRTRPPEGVFVDVAMSRWASCGVRDTGELVCWGEVRNEPPEGRYSSLSASRDNRRLCAVETDGTAVCWAHDGSGHEFAPGKFSQVSPDAECGVSLDGELQCWGTGVTRFEAPPEGRFAAVVGAAVSKLSGPPSSGPVCALDAEGVLACWGDVLNFGRSRIPEGQFTSVTTNRPEACGLRVDGDVVCWQKSVSYWEEYGVATDLAGGRVGDFVQLDTAYGGVYGRWCALTASGEMACWGDDEQSEVGTRPGPFTQIVVEGVNNCGLRVTGQVSCWGQSSEMSERGEAGPKRWDSPEGVFVSFGVSNGIACGVRDDADLVCWGYGQDNDSGNDLAALKAGSMMDLRLRETGLERVWVDSLSVCVLGTEGTFECFENPTHLHGEAQPLALEFVGEPGSVGLDREWEPDVWSYVVTGYCTLRADGTPYCSNPDTAAALPTGRFADIDFNERCGVRLDGRIECWGYYDNHSGPEGVGPFVDVALGEYTACGIERDSTVACWDNATLERVDNADADMGFPYDYVPFTEGAARFAEGNPGCAIGVDGTLIGDCRAAVLATSGPVETSEAPLGIVTDVAFGVTHACAVLADGTVTCWGAEYDTDACAEVAEGMVACWGAEYEDDEVSTSAFEH